MINRLHAFSCIFSGLLELSNYEHVCTFGTCVCSYHLRSRLYHFLNSLANRFYFINLLVLSGSFLPGFLTPGVVHDLGVMSLRKTNT